jgi:hypothetical protein
MSGSPGGEIAVAAPAAPAEAPASPAGAVPAPLPAPEAPVCENCAAPVTGPYCAQCGQKHGHSVHSVWHFLREATEGLTHADSRLWLTLATLLARPGALTREFLDGHRVRYLPPLRLYLVISLVFFLVAALGPENGRNVVSVSVGNGTTTGYHIGPAPGSRPGDIPAAAVTPEQIAETCQNVFQKPDAFLSRFHLQQRLYNTCRKQLSDGGASFYEALLRNVERAMFVFLPLLAGFAWLLYWRPRHYYVEHLLFFVHNHSFLFLILALRNGVALVTPAVLAPLVSLLSLAVWAYIAWYLYRSMRRVYGQGRFLTLVKYGALVSVYMVTSIAGGVITILYSALTL